MKKTLLAFGQACLILGALLGISLPNASAQIRIKDITDLEGAQINHMVGFGLVVGLNGTGSKSTFTQKVAADMLQRFAVSTMIEAEGKGAAVLKTGNISAVMVTAELGPYARTGSRIDVTVSVLDDATSLEGGRLLPTPLKGVDGVDYIHAAGRVNVGGYLVSASGGGLGTAASAQKNHPTVGRIATGSIVVREARGKMACNGQLKLLLRAPDFNTARSVAKAINDKHPGSAFAVDAGTIHVFTPNERCMDLVSFISDIGMLQATADLPARVVINSGTGTIVAGHHVRISTVAISHGNLAIVTSNEPMVSQPLPFARGKTTIVPRARLGVAEQPNTVRVLDQTMTVSELATALNALGAAPRDLITIFETLHSHGALKAELIVN